jgi:hypothetical protein
MKKFFSKLVNFLHLLFGGVKQFEAYSKSHIEPSIAMIEKLKAALESPLASLITTLIPGPRR